MSIKSDLERITTLEKLGIDNTERERRLKEKWKERGRQNKRDEELYEMFKENAEKGASENDNRFSLSYVTQLPVEWNFLILLGKKNIGKTYNIHKLIDECIETDRHIVMVRITSKETLSALRPFFEEERSKVRVKGSSMGVYDLVLKTKDPKRVNKPIKVGFCASISTLTSYQGASYEKVKYIVWDECISDGVNQRLTDVQIRGFERFVSSVVRNKDDVKVIIFGNLLAKSENHKGDPLLNYYGIDPSCDCKYISSPDNAHANILFINTKGLFKGIEEQGVLGGVDDNVELNLLFNKTSADGIKTLDPPAYYNAIPLHSLILTYNNILWGIHIREIICTGYPSYLIIFIKIFNVGDILHQTENKNVFTNEEAIGNKYSHCVAYVDKDTWSDLVTHLLDYLSANRVLYANSDTAFEIDKFAKHLKNDIEYTSYFGNKLI